MKGIYKITNKKNGKSYIGQSIHCGKRLDEHCKGDQYIDKIIEKEGIENFTFEILKEVDIISQLSYWEDFYIHKYDTLEPKGYNLRLNTNLTFSKEQVDKKENSVIEDNKEEKDYYQRILRLNRNPLFYDTILIYLLYKKEPISIDKLIFLFSSKAHKGTTAKANQSIKELYKEGLIEITEDKKCKIAFPIKYLGLSAFFKNEKVILDMKTVYGKLYIFTLINNIMNYPVDAKKCLKFYPKSNKDDYNYNKRKRYYERILLELKCKCPYLKIK